MKRLLPILLTFCAATTHADPLPAEEVFKPEIHQSATADGYRTEVTIRFPDGYYLYADKTSLSGADGEQSRTPPEEKDDPSARRKSGITRRRLRSITTTAPRRSP